ncbi:MAG TPA: hypothetical protein PLC38_00735 [Methanobacterium sp.]|nr:hypothetical protein [Methanobacterium sp.]
MLKSKKKGRCQILILSNNHSFPINTELIMELPYYLINEVLKKLNLSIYFSLNKITDLKLLMRKKLILVGGTKTVKTILTKIKLEFPPLKILIFRQELLQQFFKFCFASIAVYHYGNIMPSIQFMILFPFFSDTINIKKV